MKTVHAGERSVSIWFSGEEAPRRRKALAMVRSALEERGIPPWDRTRVEVFSVGKDTLLLARPEARERTAFFFPELESLLAGTEGCAGGESSLYWDGRSYILILDPAAECPGLYEFGARGTIPPGWESHAREQGLCLMEGAALADLRRHFATPRS